MTGGSTLAFYPSRARVASKFFLVNKISLFFQDISTYPTCVHTLAGKTTDAKIYSAQSMSDHLLIQFRITYSPLPFNRRYISLDFVWRSYRAYFFINNQRTFEKRP